MTRVRFAPSPTGNLHIGNARAALINYLFAKKTGGEFVLRIDDTDKQRSTIEFEEAIYKDLKTLGINWDKTFKQSDRFDIYEDAKQKLIKNGRLYPCYETQQDLDIKRKLLASKGRPPVYDREALTLTKEQIDVFKDEGRRPHWRFKLNHEDINWHDLIRGDVHFNGALISDPVLIREDGQFLYSLCSVVDDLDFGMTHIVRGEDHVTNTATQIQLFEAVSGKPCAINFAHTSLLVDVDGGPLSKRFGSLSLQSFFEEGVEPMAVNSLLARLGTSQPVAANCDMQFFIDSFDFANFSRTPPRFDMEDLWRLNHKLFLEMDYSHLNDRLKSEIFATSGGIVTKEQWQLVRENITTLKQLKEWVDIFSGDIESKISQNSEFYACALAKIPATPWDKTTWKSWAMAVGVELSLKGKSLFMPLRQVLTGHDHGPEMASVLPLLKQTKVIERITWAEKHSS